VKAFVSMMLRELKAVRKEKTIMFAILIQLFIASFSSILLVGLMAFYDPDSIGESSSVRLTVGAMGDTSSRFVSFLRQRNLRVITFDDTAKAEDAFKRGRVDCIAYIPAPSESPMEMKLVLPDMDARATVVLMVLKGPLKEYENYLRGQKGVTLRYDDMKGKPYTTYEFLYTIIIPVLMFFPAFVAGSMMIDTLSEEVEGKTLTTLLSSPVSLNQVLGAKSAAAVLIAAVQCVLWAGLLRLNSFAIQNLGLVLFFAILVAVIITLLALMIAMIFRDRERSQFVYSVTVVIAVGISFFVDPSPFGVVSRLATGDLFLNPLSIILYVLPLILLLAVFPFISKRIKSRLV